MRGLNLLIWEENVKISNSNSLLESQTSWGVVFPVPQSHHIWPLPIQNLLKVGKP